MKQRTQTFRRSFASLLRRALTRIIPCKKIIATLTTACLLLNIAQIAIAETAEDLLKRVRTNEQAENALLNSAGFSGKPSDFHLEKKNITREGELIYITKGDKREMAGYANDTEKKAYRIQHGVMSVDDQLTTLIYGVAKERESSWQRITHAAFEPVQGITRAFNTILSDVQGHKHIDGDLVARDNVRVDRDYKQAHRERKEIDDTLLRKVRKTAVEPVYVASRVINDSVRALYDGGIQRKSKVVASVDTTVDSTTDATAAASTSDATSTSEQVVDAATSWINDFIAIDSNSDLSDAEKAAAKAAQLAELGLSTDQVISTEQLTALSSEIVAYLQEKGSDIFNCAVQSLTNLLGTSNVDMSSIALDAILVDVLTGNFDTSSSGDMQLSMFAVQKTAEKNGLTLSGYSLDQDELASVFSSGQDTIARMMVDGVGHFVVVNGVNDDGTVNCTDNGVAATYSLSDFTGEVLTSDTNATGAALSDSDMKSIKGAVTSVESSAEVQQAKADYAAAQAAGDTAGMAAAHAAAEAARAAAGYSGGADGSQVIATTSASSTYITSASGSSSAGSASSGYTAASGSNQTATTASNTTTATTSYSGYVTSFGSEQAYANAIISKESSGVALSDPAAAAAFKAANPQYFTTATNAVAGVNATVPTAANTANTTNTGASYTGYVASFGGEQAYANAIIAKESSGQALSDPAAAAAFKTAHPEYFSASAQPGTAAVTSNASTVAVDVNGTTVNMSIDDYNAINGYKDQYTAAANDPSMENRDQIMKDAHQQAEAIRAKYGYIGGADGSGNIQLSETSSADINSAVSEGLKSGQLDANTLADTLSQPKIVTFAGAATALGLTYSYDPVTGMVTVTGNGHTETFMSGEVNAKLGITGAQDGKNYVDAVALAKAFGLSADLGRAAAYTESMGSQEGYTLAGLVKTDSDLTLSDYGAWQAWVAAHPELAGSAALQQLADTISTSVDQYGFKDVIDAANAAVNAAAKTLNAGLGLLGSASGIQDLAVQLVGSVDQTAKALADSVLAASFGGDKNAYYAAINDKIINGQSFSDPVAANYFRTHLADYGFGSDEERAQNAIASFGGVDNYIQAASVKMYDGTLLDPMAFKAVLSDPAKFGAETGPIQFEQDGATYVVRGWQDSAKITDTGFGANVQGNKWDITTSSLGEDGQQEIAELFAGQGVDAVRNTLIETGAYQSESYRGVYGDYDARNVGYTSVDGAGKMAILYSSSGGYNDGIWMKDLQAGQSVLVTESVKAGLLEKAAIYSLGAALDTNSAYVFENGLTAALPYALGDMQQYSEWNTDSAGNRSLQNIEFKDGKVSAVESLALVTKNGITSFSDAKRYVFEGAYKGAADETADGTQVQGGSGSGQQGEQGTDSNPIIQYYQDVLKGVNELMLKGADSTAIDQFSSQYIDMSKVVEINYSATAKAGSISQTDYANGVTITATGVAFGSDWRNNYQILTGDKSSGYVDMVTSEPGKSTLLRTTNVIFNDAKDISSSTYDYSSREKNFVRVTENNGTNVTKVTSYVNVSIDSTSKTFSPEGSTYLTQTYDSSGNLTGAEMVAAEGGWKPVSLIPSEEVLLGMMTGTRLEGGSALDLKFTVEGGAPKLTQINGKDVTPEALAEIAQGMSISTVTSDGKRVSATLGNASFKEYQGTYGLCAIVTGGEYYLPNASSGGSADSSDAGDDPALKGDPNFEASATIYADSKGMLFSVEEGKDNGVQIIQGNLLWQTNNAKYQFVSGTITRGAVDYYGGSGSTLEYHNDENGNPQEVFKNTNANIITSRLSNKSLFSDGENDFILSNSEKTIGCRTDDNGVLYTARDVTCDQGAVKGILREGAQIMLTLDSQIVVTQGDMTLLTDAEIKSGVSDTRLANPSADDNGSSETATMPEVNSRGVFIATDDGYIAKKGSTVSIRNGQLTVVGKGTVFQAGSKLSDGTKVTSGNLKIADFSDEGQPIFVAESGTASTKNGSLHINYNTNGVSSAWQATYLAGTNAGDSGAKYTQGSIITNFKLTTENGYKVLALDEDGQLIATGSWYNNVKVEFNGQSYSLDASGNIIPSVHTYSITVNETFNYWGYSGTVQRTIEVTDDGLGNITFAYAGTGQSIDVKWYDSDTKTVVIGNDENGYFSTSYYKVTFGDFGQPSLSAFTSSDSFTSHKVYYYQMPDGSQGAALDFSTTIKLGNDGKLNQETTATYDGVAVNSNRIFYGVVNPDTGKVEDLGIIVEPVVHENEYHSTYVVRDYAVEGTVGNSDGTFTTTKFNKTNGVFDSIERTNYGVVVSGMYAQTYAKMTTVSNSEGITYWNNTTYVQYMPDGTTPLQANEFLEFNWQGKYIANGAMYDNASLRNGDGTIGRLVNKNYVDSSGQVTSSEFTFNGASVKNELQVFDSGNQSIVFFKSQDSIKPTLRGIYDKTNVSLDAAAKLVTVNNANVGTITGDAGDLTVYGKLVIGEYGDDSVNSDLSIKGTLNGTTFDKKLTYNADTMRYDIADGGITGITGDFNGQSIQYDIQSVSASFDMFSISLNIQAGQSVEGLSKLQPSGAGAGGEGSESESNELYSLTLGQSEDGKWTLTNTGTTAAPVNAEIKVSEALDNKIKDIQITSFNAGTMLTMLAGVTFDDVVTTEGYTFTSTYKVTQTAKVLISTEGGIASHLNDTEFIEGVITNSVTQTDSNGNVTTFDRTFTATRYGSEEDYSAWTVLDVTVKDGNGNNVKNLDLGNGRYIDYKSAAFSVEKTAGRQIGEFFISAGKWIAGVVLYVADSYAYSTMQLATAIATRNMSDEEKSAYEEVMDKSFVNQLMNVSVNLFKTKSEDIYDQGIDWTGLASSLFNPQAGDVHGEGIDLTAAVTAQEIAKAGVIALETVVTAVLLTASVILTGGLSLTLIVGIAFTAISAYQGIQSIGQGDLDGGMLNFGMMAVSAATTFISAFGAAGKAANIAASTGQKTEALVGSTSTLAKVSKAVVGKVASVLNPISKTVTNSIANKLVTGLVDTMAKTAVKGVLGKVMTWAVQSVLPGTVGRVALVNSVSTLLKMGMNYAVFKGLPALAVNLGIIDNESFLNGSLYKAISNLLVLAPLMFSGMGPASEASQGLISKATWQGAKEAIKLAIKSPGQALVKLVAPWWPKAGMKAALQTLTKETIAKGLLGVGKSVLGGLNPFTLIPRTMGVIADVTLFQTGSSAILGTVNSILGGRPRQFWIFQIPSFRNTADAIMQLSDSAVNSAIQSLSFSALIAVASPILGPLVKNLPIVGPAVTKLGEMGNFFGGKFASGKLGRITGFIYEEGFQEQIPQMLGGAILGNGQASEVFQELFDKDGSSLSSQNISTVASARLDGTFEKSVARTNVNSATSVQLVQTALNGTLQNNGFSNISVDILMAPKDSGTDVVIKMLDTTIPGVPVTLASVKLSGNTQFTNFAVAVGAAAAAGNVVGQNLTGSAFVDTVMLNDAILRNDGNTKYVQGLTNVEKIDFLVGMTGFAASGNVLSQTEAASMQDAGMEPLVVMQAHGDGTLSTVQIAVNDTATAMQYVESMLSVIGTQKTEADIQNVIGTFNVYGMVQAIASSGVSSVTLSSVAGMAGFAAAIANSTIPVAVRQSMLTDLMPVLSAMLGKLDFSNGDDQLESALANNRHNVMANLRELGNGILKMRDSNLRILFASALMANARMWDSVRLYDQMEQSQVTEPEGFGAASIAMYSALSLNMKNTLGINNILSNVGLIKDAGIRTKVTSGLAALLAYKLQNSSRLTNADLSTIDQIAASISGSQVTPENAAETARTLAILETALNNQDPARLKSMARDTLAHVRQLIASQMNREEIAQYVETAKAAAAEIVGRDRTAEAAVAQNEGYYGKGAAVQKDMKALVKDAVDKAARIAKNSKNVEESLRQVIKDVLNASDAEIMEALSARETGDARKDLIRTYYNDMQERIANKESITADIIMLSMVDMMKRFKSWFNDFNDQQKEGFREIVGQLLSEGKGSKRYVHMLRTGGGKTFLVSLTTLLMRMQTTESGKFIGALTNTIDNANDIAKYLNGIFGSETPGDSEIGKVLVLSADDVENARKGARELANVRTKIAEASVVVTTYDIWSGLIASDFAQLLADDKNPAVSDKICKLLEDEKIKISKDQNGRKTVVDSTRAKEARDLILQAAQKDDTIAQALKKTTIPLENIGDAVADEIDFFSTIPMQALAKAMGKYYSAQTVAGYYTELSKLNDWNAKAVNRFIEKYRAIGIDDARMQKDLQNKKASAGAATLYAKINGLVRSNTVVSDILASREITAAVDSLGLSRVQVEADVKEFVANNKAGQYFGKLSEVTRGLHAKSNASKGSIRIGSDLVQVNEAFKFSMRDANGRLALIDDIMNIESSEATEDIEALQNKASAEKSAEIDLKKLVKAEAEKLKKEYGELFSEKEIIEHLWNGTGAHKMVQDREYVVKDGRIIVTNLGREVENLSLPAGMMQVLETVHNVDISKPSVESYVSNSVFAMGLFNNIVGLTGTISQANEVSVLKRMGFNKGGNAGRATGHDRLFQTANGADHFMFQASKMMNAKGVANFNLALAADSARAKAFYNNLKNDVSKWLQEVGVDANETQEILGLLSSGDAAKINDKSQALQRRFADKAAAIQNIMCNTMKFVGADVTNEELEALRDQVKEGSYKWVIGDAYLLGRGWDVGDMNDAAKILRKVQGASAEKVQANCWLLEAEMMTESQMLQAAGRVDPFGKNRFDTDSWSKDIISLYSVEYAREVEILRKAVGKNGEWDIATVLKMLEKVQLDNEEQALKKAGQKVVTSVAQQTFVDGQKSSAPTPEQAVQKLQEYGLTENQAKVERDKLLGKNAGSTKLTSAQWYTMELMGRYYALANRATGLNEIPEMLLLTEKDIDALSANPGSMISLLSLKLRTSGVQANADIKQKLAQVSAKAQDLSERKVKFDSKIAGLSESKRMKAQDSPVWYALTHPGMALNSAITGMRERQLKEAVDNLTNSYISAMPNLGQEKEASSEISRAASILKSLAGFKVDGTGTIILDENLVLDAGQVKQLQAIARIDANSKMSELIAPVAASNAQDIAKKLDKATQGMEDRVKSFVGVPAAEKTLADVIQQAVNADENISPVDALRAINPGLAEKLDQLKGTNTTISEILSGESLRKTAIADLFGELERVYIKASAPEAVEGLKAVLAFTETLSDEAVSKLAAVAGKKSSLAKDRQSAVSVLAAFAQGRKADEKSKQLVLEKLAEVRDNKGTSKQMREYTDAQISAIADGLINPAAAGKGNVKELTGNITKVLVGAGAVLSSMTGVPAIAAAVAGGSVVVNMLINKFAGSKDTAAKADAASEEGSKMKAGAVLKDMMGTMTGNSKAAKIGTILSTAIAAAGVIASAAGWPAGLTVAVLAGAGIPAVIALGSLGKTVISKITGAKPVEEDIPATITTLLKVLEVSPEALQKVDASALKRFETYVQANKNDIQARTGLAQLYTAAGDKEHAAVLLAEAETPSSWSEGQKMLSEQVFGVTQPKEIGTYLVATLQVCQNARQMYAKLGLGSAGNAETVSVEDIVDAYFVVSNDVLVQVKAGKLTMDQAEVQIGIYRTVKDLLIAHSNGKISRADLDNPKPTSQQLADISEILSRNTSVAASSIVKAWSAGNAKAMSIELDASVIDDLRTAVNTQRSASAFTRLWESARRTMSHEQTLEDKMKDVLGSNLNLDPARLDRTMGAIMDPISAQKISQAA